MERQPNPDDPAYRDQSTRRRLEEKKSKTPGQQLEEEGGYLDTGELDEEGKPLLSEEIDVESLTNQQKQKEEAKKWKKFDDAVAGAKSKEDLIEAGKIRKDIEERLGNNWVSLSTLAFETFIGIGADVLLASPDPISRGLNYGIGYGTNILAQWLRGEEIKQGRAHAAGAFQTIPLGTTAKGLKGIARATGKGAVGSVVGEQVAVGIDENRVLTPQEVGYAGAFGGTFGGLTKGALDNVDITRFKNTLKRLSKKRQVIVNPDGTLSIADDSIDDLAKQSAKPMRMTGGGSVGSGINWNKYGYTPGTEPTQVRNITIPELKTEVANSLDAFYQKTQEVVQSRVGSRASSSQIKNALKNQPQYWANPITQKIYRAAWKGGLSKRYTLKPINRQYLEKQQSTAIQKQIQTQYQKDIQRKNIDLKKAWTDNEQGRWYTEHNVYLQSEKARNYILDNSGVRINDSSEFQLGNIANQTPRLENLKNPDTLVFRKVKNRFETVLDKTSDEYFQYPNYIVNSNPRLSGGREGIIRIEYSPIEWQQVPGSNPPIMRPVLTDFKVKGGILSGKSVVEIDTKDIDFIRNNLNTTEDVQNWLSREHGINPVAQGESFPRQGFEIRLSKSPVKSTQVQIKEFKKLIEEVQAGRKTWDEVFKEAGYEVIPQTGRKRTRGPGKKPKGTLRRKRDEAKFETDPDLKPDQNIIDETKPINPPDD